MSYQDPWHSQYGAGEAASPKNHLDSSNNGTTITGDSADMNSSTANVTSSISQLTESHAKVDISDPRVSSPHNASSGGGGYGQPYAMSSNMHPNAAVMMMNSQVPQMPQMMGGVIPLNVIMPPNFQLDTSKNIKKSKKRRKKDKNKPKRPLSAYNLFFKDEREKILAQIPKESEVEVNEKITWPGKKRPPHGKISFEELARTIGARWQSLDKESKSHYKKKADEDLERYATEMKIYDKRNKQQFKSPLSDEEVQEDDVKRARDDVKMTSSSDAKRKKNRKLSKDSKEESPTKASIDYMTRSSMQDASMGKMMAMNVAGNYMFPMMFNPRSGQPMDELEMMKAQQQMLTNKIAQETERRRKMQQQQQQQQHHHQPPQHQQGNPDPRSNDYHGISHNRSFGQYQRFGPDTTNDDYNPINPNSISPHFMSSSFDQGAAPPPGMFHSYSRKPYDSSSIQNLNDNFPTSHGNQNNMNDFPPFPPPDDPFFDRGDSC